jgi:hypothetical protein
VKLSKSFITPLWEYINVTAVKESANVKSSQTAGAALLSWRLRLTLQEPRHEHMKEIVTRKSTDIILSHYIGSDGKYLRLYCLWYNFCSLMHHKEWCIPYVNIMKYQIKNLKRMILRMINRHKKYMDKLLSDIKEDVNKEINGIGL